MDIYISSILNLMKQAGLLIFFFFLISTSGCKRHQSILQGYIDARFAYIAPEYPGLLIQLFVSRGDTIKKGQTLFIIEEEPQSYESNQANANLQESLQQREELKNTLLYKQKILQRRSYLIKMKQLPPEQYDTAFYDFQMAQGELNRNDQNIKSLSAKLEQANWVKTKKTVIADKPGLVFDTYFIPSEYVYPSKPILSLLYPEQVYAVFFVNESMRSKIKLGQRINISCDGYDKSVKGKITYISPQADYTPPVIYSAQSRGKLTYKIEAVNMTKDNTCFHPGQPIDVTIQ